MPQYMLLLYRDEKAGPQEPAEKEEHAGNQY